MSKLSSQFRPGATRKGFSLIELLIVVVIAGVLLSISGNSIGRQIARDRVLRSATVVQGMLTEASQLAVRRRLPVTVTLVTGTGELRISDRATGTVLRKRLFGSAYDLKATPSLNPSTGIVIFPNGRADAALTVTLTGAGMTRTVTRSATGIVRRP